MTQSPSHHRDLSHLEKDQFNATIDELDSAIGAITGRMSSNFGEVRPIAAAPSVVNEIDVERAARGLDRIHHGLLSDLTACSAALKTTRLVFVLGRAIECVNDPVVNSSVAAASSIRTIRQVSARLLRLLAEHTHSRRAYNAIMQNHAAAFESLVHQEETVEDASALLYHVLLYTQDAADVRQILLAHGLVEHLLERLLQQSRSSGGYGWGIRVLHAIAASTPPVSSDVLLPIIRSLGTILGPLLLSASGDADGRDRGWFVSDHLADGCHLAATLGLEFPGEPAVRDVCEQLAHAAQRNGLEQHAGLLEACIGNINATIYPIVSSLSRELRIIRKNNLDTLAVQQALSALHTTVSQGQKIQQNGLAFAFAHFPAAMKTLCGTLASVDEKISSLSCVILTAVTSSVIVTSSSLVEQQQCTASVVDQFVAMDGVLLLADMLFDYSEDVLGGAFGLLRTFSGHATAEQHVIECGALRRVVHLVEQLSGRVEAAGDGCSGSLLVTTALCFDFISRLSSTAIAAHLQPIGRSLSSFCTYVTVQKGTTLSVLAQPLLRCVSALAAVDPTFPPLMCEDVWKSTTSLHCPPSGDQSANIIAAMLGAISSCISSCPDLATTWSNTICAIGTAILQAGATSLYTRLWSLVSDAGQTAALPLYQQIFSSSVLFMIKSPEMFERHLASTLHVASVLQLSGSTDDAFCAVGQIALSEHPFSEDVRTAAVECLCGTRNPLLPSTLVRIILMCEDASTDDASGLANLCFHGLINSGGLAVGELTRIGLIALDVASGDAERSSESLGWLQPIADSDDAHDTLVAIVPLLNGMLHHSEECRTAAGSFGTTNFFLRLLSSGPLLEVPLKVLSLYGLWHVLNGETGTAESQALYMATSSNIFSTLTALLEEAAMDDQQSPDALCEIHHAVYLLAERLLLMLRNLAEVIAPVLDFIERRVLRDVRESQACELFLFVLQDDGCRAELRRRCPAEYAAALTIIHGEALPHREHQSFQYLLMQIEKYMAELGSMTSSIMSPSTLVSGVMMAATQYPSTYQNSAE